MGHTEKLKQFEQSAVEELPSSVKFSTSFQKACKSAFLVEVCGFMMHLESPLLHVCGRNAKNVSNM